MWPHGIAQACTSCDPLQGVLGRGGAPGDRGTQGSTVSFFLCVCVHAHSLYVCACTYDTQSLAFRRVQLVVVEIKGTPAPLDSRYT